MAVVIAEIATVIFFILYPLLYDFPVNPANATSFPAVTVLLRYLTFADCCLPAVQTEDGYISELNEDSITSRLPHGISLSAPLYY
jgi:hypothetical protein